LEALGLSYIHTKVPGLCRDTIPDVWVCGLAFDFLPGLTLFLYLTLTYTYVYVYLHSTLFSKRHNDMAFLRRAREWDLDIDHYLNRIVPPSPLRHFPTPVSRFLGYRKEQKPDVGNVLGAWWSFVGAFCGLAVVAAVFNNTESIRGHSPPALIASFVCLLRSSCPLVLNGAFGWGWDA
jgi:hypothetical protein